jgi:hypothetical protein
MFPEQVKQKAIELSKGRSAGKTLEALRRQVEFKDEPLLPTERTIRRWINEAKRQQSQAAESAETVKKPRERLITNDAVYEKVMDIPPWAKNPFR